MSMVAVIPIANMASANITLANLGFGNDCFSVPAWTNGTVSFGAFHAWNDTAFSTAVKAIPSVVWEESDGDPITRTNALINAQGAKYGAQAPPLTGTTVAGNLYRHSDGVLFNCIQPYNTATWPDPYAIPALIRIVREPNTVTQWIQPIDQYDSYKLVNTFTGKPDRCLNLGKTWETMVNNNVWIPGVQGSESLWKEVT